MFAAFSIVLVILALDPILRLVVLALDWNNNHLSHISAFPLISATLRYRNREKIFSKTRTSLLAAVMCMAFGTILFGTGKAYEAHLSENDYLTLMTSSRMQRHSFNDWSGCCYLSRRTSSSSFRMEEDGFAHRPLSPFPYSSMHCGS